MGERKIRVLLVDDHPIVREGIRGVLAAAPRIEVVGEARDGLEAIRLAARLRPDIVMMDISMPQMNGLEATQWLRQELPEARVIALTMHADDEYIRRLGRLGARGYVGKQSPPRDLVQAVEEVAQGRLYFSPQAVQVLLQDYAEAHPPPDRPEREALSRREREVLSLLASDASTKEIAARLAISQRTVEAHRGHIMRKLGISTRAGLTRYALAQGIVDL